MPVRFTLPHQRGRNLLLLEDLLDDLARLGIDGDLLLRASDRSELDRLLAHGTTRGGFPEREPWRDGRIEGRTLLHEDVLFGTTPDEIRRGERDPARSTSFKKLPGMARPMVQVYARDAFERIADRQYLFRQPTRKLDALRAVCELDVQDPIDGWFSEDAGMRYRELVRDAAGGIVVEVGCWKGLSTSYVARLAANQGTRMICVDHWNGSSDAYDCDYRATLAVEDVAATFARNLARLGLVVETRRAMSIEAARSFAGAALDLVFLDASHDAGAMAADLDAWSTKLKPGGVIAGHDFNERHPGVVEAVRAFAETSGHTLDVDGRSVWALRPSR